MCKCISTVTRVETKASECVAANSERKERHGEGRVNGSPPIISSNFSADKQQHSRPNHHDERQRQSARRSGWRRKQPQTRGRVAAEQRGQRASNERARRSIRTAGLVCVHQGGRVRENSALPRPEEDDGSTGKKLNRQPTGGSHQEGAVVASGVERE